MDEAFRQLVTTILYITLAHLNACPQRPINGMGAPMTEKPSSSDRPRMAGGIFIFLGLMIGAIAGVALGEPSLGMITGFGIGVALAVIVWLVDSKRANKR
jgi:hypothetical protein